jgi:hypothetical protein
MRNCHELANELARRIRKRQHSLASGRPAFQTNVVIEELDDTGLENEIVDFEVALSSLDLGKEEWLVDSGASKHVTGDRNVFSNLELNPGAGASIQMVGNERLHVQGSGTVNLGSASEINI